MQFLWSIAADCDFSTLFSKYRFSSALRVVLRDLVDIFREIVTSIPENLCR